MLIHIPKAYNCPRLIYSINVLFCEFLGLKYTISISDCDSIEVRGLKKNLLIPSSFFSNITYQSLSIVDIPNEIDKDMINIGNENLEIVSIFGTSLISESENEIILHSDIFASTFFMLSRWEESFNDKKDAHGRFPAKESLAFKHDFLERPIVNEYVELLWAILTKLGCNQKRKNRTFTLVPTHDVDKPYMFDGWLRNLRYIAGSLKRGRFTELVRYSKHLTTNTDPFDTYDKLMDQSEKSNTKSHFFFLQKGKAKQDENHEIDTTKVRALISKIKSRGHNIGFHPSYHAYDNESLFRKEKQNLERISGQDIDSGRHHFLRWDVTATPQIWQKNKMKWDSTLGYADHAGFRCGVCYSFPLYDLKNNKQLDVYERPLIAMEWSLIHYQGLGIEASEKYIQKLKTEVKKYQGEFVFLYHNSAFFTDDYVHLSQRLLKSFYD